MKPNSRNILHVLLALMDTALPHGLRNRSQTICKAYFSVGFFSRCDVIEAKRFPGSSEREEMITPALCVSFAWVDGLHINDTASYRDCSAATEES